MSSRVKYTRLKTLADVKAERIRISNEIDRAEERLQDDYERITEMFSIDYLMGVVSEKTARIYSMIQWISSGYSFVASIIQKYRKPQVAEEQEEEYCTPPTEENK